MNITLPISAKKHVLTLIGDNAMNRLRGQHCPDPDSYTCENDGAGLFTLKCKFSTQTNTEDSEHWTATITYPHSSGSKFQVTCEEHAAYTDNMASPCCCVVRMHLFSTKSDLDRRNDPEALRDMPNIAPGTQFYGDFLEQIYHPSLLVTEEKQDQVRKLHIKINSSFGIPITQNKVDSYAFDERGVAMRDPPPVRPAPLHNKKNSYKHVFYRLEKNRNEDHLVEKDKKSTQQENT